MAQDFKFPDEVGGVNPLDDPKDELIVSVEGDEPEIVIEDDTPAKDKFAKPLDRKVDDPSDEEIEGYTKNVQSRIKELTHARHDERRAKEAAERQKEEALRFAQQVFEENKRLKEYVQTGENSYQEMMKTSAESKLEAARRKLKEAQESFDADAIIEANEALTSAMFEKEAAKNFKPTPLQAYENPVQMQQSVQETPQTDEKTLRWQAKNQWFGSAGYEDMTAFALGLHQKLVSTGVDPRSDEYYDRIDGRLRSVFPEVFQEPESRKTPEPAKKPATVVASATRTTGAKKQVKISPSAAALADRLGIPRDLYAQEYLKQEAKNG
jgi:hypothetical protein